MKFITYPYPESLPCNAKLTLHLPGSAPDPNICLFTSTCTTLYLVKSIQKDLEVRFYFSVK